MISMRGAARRARTTLQMRHSVGYTPLSTYTQQQMRNAHLAPTTASLPLHIQVERGTAPLGSLCRGLYASRLFGSLSKRVEYGWDDPTRADRQQLVNRFRHALQVIQSSPTCLHELLNDIHDVTLFMTYPYVIVDYRRQ